MKRYVLGATLLAAIVLVPTIARAQGAEEQAWGPGTTLSLFAGASIRDSSASFVGSGSIGWEFTRYFAVEGSGLWISEPNGGFAALFGPRIGVRAVPRVMPSVFAGVGMWVESQEEEVAPGQTLEKTVEEFAFATGVGVDFYLSNHLAIRPDFRLMFINLSSDTHMVPIFGVHVTYHFESHPYLPGR